MHFDFRFFNVCLLENLSTQNFLHHDMWQVAFIVMVVFMWLVRIDKMVTREKSKISFPS